MKQNTYKYYLAFIFLLFFFANSFSQTKIRGVIVNDETSRPIPFTSVSFVNSTIGCISDEDGIFFIEANTDIDKIIISNMGFINDTVDVVNNIYQDFIIYLKPDNYNIQEVIVSPGENPADILMKKVFRHKKQNNTNRLDAYSYEQYTKMQVDINNINPEAKDDPVLNNFKVAFAGLDTSAATGKIYMPLIISENISDFYYKKFPKNRKEVIKAVNFAGVENLSVSQFTGQMYVDFNFYKSYINILEKEFISPLALSGLMVYDYALLDSAYVDNIWCYHISFNPKRKYEFTFKGDMWITDKTFALKKITAHMSKTANLGFVSDFYVKKDYQKTGDNFFFPAQEEFFIDFNISKFAAGLFGRKFTSRKNIELNPKFPTLFFSPTEFRDIEIENKASEYDEDFWKEHRHTKLTNKEENIFIMVDSVKNQPAFKKIEDFVYLLATGYLRRSYIEFGPYYKVYSKNAIEGHRIRLGARTSQSFSKNFELNSYLAFGLDDQRAKYGIGSKWKINRKPWTLAQINYSNDMIQLGANLGDFGSDNIFSVSGKNDKLLWIENFETGIERDLFKSLTGTVFFTHKEISPTDSIRFINNNSAEQANITATEITVSLHFGINEEFFELGLQRYSLGSLYPILELEYTHSLPNIFDNDYNYSKLTLGLRHHITYPFLGKTKYYIEAGKIQGTVPFPLLKLHEGSAGIGYNMYAFNLMDYYEFASDKYISFFAEHHFNGLFLNKIPFLRKLKFREVIYAKGAWGSLTDENRNLMQFPTTLSDIKKPYIEVGMGVENILSILSINYFRRLSHLQKPGVRKQGIIIGLQVNF